MAVLLEGMTTFAMQKVLDGILKEGAVTFPTTVYVALHSDEPGMNASANELSGNGYSRKAITFGSAAADGNAQKSLNNAEVLFDEATASWGTVKNFSLWDAATAGNSWFIGKLTTEKAVPAGDQARFKSGTLYAKISPTETTV